MSARHETKKAFDIRWLRSSAYISWLLLPLYWAIVQWQAPTGSKADKNFMTYLLSPFWLIMFIHSVYYGHLIVARFKISLGSFVALSAVWGGAVAFSWATIGWESGITVGLGFAGLLGFALTWGRSISLLLEIEGMVLQTFIIVLGALIPVCLLVAPACVLSCIYLRHVLGPKVAIVAGLFGAVALVLLIVAAFLSARARRSAQLQLANR